MATMSIDHKSAVIVSNFNATKPSKWSPRKVKVRSYTRYHPETALKIQFNISKREKRTNTITKVCTKSDHF